MAIYEDLRDAVVAITARPDLVVEMQVAIRTALWKFHGKETFKRDLRIVTLDMSLYPSASNRWSFNTGNSTVFPQFRRANFIRIPPQNWPENAYKPPPADFPWGFPRQPTFEEVDADNIFDNYQIERTNYWYQAGTSINLVATFTPTFLDIGYYAWPLMVAQPGGTFNIQSWIATQFPDSISTEAASTIFKMIGKDDEAQRYAQIFNENFSIVAATDVGV